MSNRSKWLALTGLATAFAASACGSEIGDACVSSLDCSPDGDRFCDTSSDGDGYCTVVGCDYDTCPENSVCIRFFTGTFANRPCDPATEDLTTDMCSVDEVCPLEGFCAPRSSELRYCMATCESTGDCRDGYECRDLELMRSHGGEPVMPVGERVGAAPAQFCALAPI